MGIRLYLKPFDYCTGALFYGMILFTVWFCSPYMLVPFYSISNGEILYEDQRQFTNLPTAQYPITVKASVDAEILAEFTKSPPIGIISGFRANLTVVGNNSFCPPNFVRFPNVTQFDLPCLQGTLTELAFLKLSLDSDALESAASRGNERPEIVDIYEHFIDGSANSSTGGASDYLSPLFLVQSWLFADQSVVGNDDCSSDAQCFDFWNNSTQEMGRFAYNRSEISCFPKQFFKDELDWAYSGCAISIYTAPRSCFVANMPASIFGYSTQSTCALQIYFNVLQDVPNMVLVIWSWGLIGFVTFYAFWMIGAVLYARRLHTNYLSYYYFRQNSFGLKKENTYLCKVYISGQQYTQCSGKFKLVSADGTVIYERNVSCQFGTEDVDGSNFRTLMFRMKGLKFSRNYANVHYEMDWGASESDPQFTLPYVQISIRQRIPTRVLTSWSLVFQPVFFLINLCRVSRKEFIRYGDYVFYTLFLTFVWLSIAWPLIFTLIALIQYGNVEHPNVWSSPTHRAQAPLALFILFLLCVVIPPMLTFLPFLRARPTRWWQQKAVPDFCILTDNDRQNCIPYEYERFSKKDRSSSSSSEPPAELELATEYQPPVFTTSSAVNADEIELNELLKKNQ